MRLSLSNVGHARRDVRTHVKRVPTPWSLGPPAALAIAVIVTATLCMHIPYFALEPGPTQDVSRIIRIRGVRTRPVNGRLLLTTVSLYPIRVADAVRGWIDPATAIVSRGAIVPADESNEEAERRTTQEMDESQLVAAAEALSLLGYDVGRDSGGVRIEDVASDVPAFGVLRRGDVVVEADDRRVKGTDDLIAQVGRHRVGDDVRLRVSRGEESLEVLVRTVSDPEDPRRPVIGVRIDDIPIVRLPLAVDIDETGIGGPSGALMFAVGIYDLLSPDDLARGRTIAGTGTFERGRVGAVGGIRQKLEASRRAGADLFLVPADELRQACALAGELPIVAVSTLREAVSALKGGHVPAERRCA